MMRSPAHAMRALRAVVLILAACGATACAPGRAGVPGAEARSANPARSSDLQAQLDRSVRSQPLVLLGEVHDNAAQHRLRAEAWRALLASGARPALLMEQFDRERQTDLDRALAQPGATADQVIAAGRSSADAWDWPLYRPFIEAALAHGVPVVAANVSRADTRRVMGQGLAALGFEARVPEDVLASHAQDIEQSHCGLVNLAQARRMAVAQVARDQFMARLLALHAGRGAVLLAGNGHVRRDTGIARWLPPELASRSVSIGLLERGEGSPGVYDVRITTEPARRADPCEGLRNATPT